MSKYLIVASGCDASTYAVIALTDREYEVMQRVAAAVNARARSGCHPTLQIKPADQMTDYERECVTDTEENE